MTPHEKTIGIKQILALKIVSFWKYSMMKNQKSNKTFRLGTRLSTLRSGVEWNEGKWKKGKQDDESITERSVFRFTAKMDKIISFNI